MRFELSGSLVRPDPLVIKFNSNQTFDVSKYIGLGYTHFEVICIGGGGGLGGGIDTGNTGTLIRNTGGAGGGGGFHSVHGLLSALPATCPVVVGAGGAMGTEHVSNPALTTDGGDGGGSSFNDTTCRASGGKGGKRSQSNSATVTTQAHGGEGGVGNRIIAGGGAAGGIAGTPAKPPNPYIAGTAGIDGTLFQNVGKGGGGGSGGVGEYGAATPDIPATAGGRGSYNPGDTSVYGLGGPPVQGSVSGVQNIIPGYAGGAKAAPLNGLPTVYGQSKSAPPFSGDPGTVILRLTAK
jgi:hypothetical protein